MKNLFYVKWPQEPFPLDITFPVFILFRDNWNDYGYRTLFNIIYYKSRNEYFELGNIKVLQKETETTDQITTILPNYFYKLNNDYGSLGQSLTYYENVKLLFPDTFTEVLTSLNDVSINGDLANSFKTFFGFKRSLLRFTSAERAFQEAWLLLYENSRKVNEDLHFTYFIKFPEADSNHVVDFDFKKQQLLPYRINVLIGKNGTGKTQFLGSLVNSIAGVTKIKSFTPYNPLFNKVISISYSLFDDFPKPSTTTAFNYKYIGLRTKEEELISDKNLSAKLQEALKEINRRERTEEWFAIINSIVHLENFGLTSDKEISEEWINSLNFNKTNRLSSGQSILLFIMTELIANIEEESLVLFDEPETHLHPSAIALLINNFYRILKQYKSYSIISTHSPIIIQDIPSRYIRVFDREGNTPIIRKLPIESFGENISVLTSSVFGTVDVKELYKKYLERMFDNAYSTKEINNLFDNKLSFNAQLFLAALEQGETNEKS